MGMGTSEHARALELFEHGNSAEALTVLQDAVREAVDPEMLNDLAVLAMRAGDAGRGCRSAARAVRLHP